MNQPAEPIASHDPSVGRTGFDAGRPRLRGPESQPSVGTMAIVMMDEDGDRPFEMLAIQNEQPVGTFIAYGSHEALRDGIRLR